MKTTHLITLVFVIFLTSSCEALINMYYKRLSFELSKEGRIMIDKYTIDIVPHCSGEFPENAIDSCMLVIRDKDTPSLCDTMVYYPRLGSHFRIIGQNNHRWKLKCKEGNYRCSSHFLDVQREDQYDNDQWGDFVLDVEKTGMSSFALDYADTKSSPPYLMNRLFNSTRKWKGTKVTHAASINNDYLAIDWYYTELCNTFVLNWKKRNVADTLRWLRVSSRDENCGSFMIYKDTLILDDNGFLLRPSAHSPLVIRRHFDLKDQYPLFWTQFPSTAYRNRDSLSVSYPTLEVNWVSGGIISKDQIIFRRFYFPSSPTDGQDISEQFYNDHVFYPGM